MAAHLQFESAQALADTVSQDQSLQNQIKQDPATVLQSLAVPALPDTWIYRMVVGSLGLTVLIALLGAIVLACIRDGKIPDVLTALGSASVGALAGLLAPSPVARK